MKHIPITWVLYMMIHPLCDGFIPESRPRVPSATGILFWCADSILLTYYERTRFRVPVISSLFFIANILCNPFLPFTHNFNQLLCELSIYRFMFISGTEWPRSVQIELIIWKECYLSERFIQYFRALSQNSKIERFLLFLNFTNWK